MDSVLQLLKDSKFRKEIKKIDGYEQYLNSSFYEGGLGGMLNQLEYAIDFRDMSFIHLSKNVKEVFGLEYEFLKTNGPMSIYDFIPDEDNQLLDREILKEVSIAADKEKDFEPENLRFAYNFRINTNNGKLRCILNRLTVIIYGDHGLPLVTVGTMTDVTHMCNENKLFCEGSRINADGTISVILHKEFPLLNKEKNHNLSKKEIEVLRLVMEGHISKEIAILTNRSIETIHSHRKNIIKKLKCNSITDAALLAKGGNWF
ncbi:MAG: LuxR C-terminal-related transcriptional regulator [Crocinitomicaceae bacterium]